MDRVRWFYLKVPQITLVFMQSDGVEPYERRYLISEKIFRLGLHHKRISVGVEGQGNLF